MSNNNFYDEKIALIKSKVKSDPKSALELLNEELDMPYIPKRYEDEFRKIYFDIADTQEVSILNNNLSIDDVFDIILNNGEKIQQAIKQLSDYNLSANTLRLKKIFNSNLSNSIKAIIYEILVKQKINENFQIDFNVLNPYIDGSLINTKSNITTFDFFHKNIIKNPTLLNICRSLFYDYLISYFPKFNTEIIFEEILYIANETLGIKNNSDANINKIIEIKKVLNI